VARAIFDTQGFRFARLTSFRDPDFLPAILALSAPHVLRIAGEGDKVPDRVAAAYASAGKPDAVRGVVDLGVAIDALTAP
jgi:hypothetical protein